MLYGKNCSLSTSTYFATLPAFYGSIFHIYFQSLGQITYAVPDRRLAREAAMVCGNMEVESSKSYIDNLYDNHEDKVGSAVITLKNAVIGSQRQKDTIIEQGVLARLIHLLVDPDISTRIKTDVVYILGSITNGSESNLKSLNDADVVSILLNGLVSQDECLVQVPFKLPKLDLFVNQSFDGYFQASLCCLRSLLQSKDLRQVFDSINFGLEREREVRTRRALGKREGRQEEKNG